MFLKISIEFVEKALLGAFLFEYILLPLVLPDSACSLLKSVSLLCLALLLPFGKNKNRSSLIGMGSAALLLVVICQILLFRNSATIKLLVNIVLFLLFFRYSSFSLAEFFGGLVKLGGLLALFPVIFFCIKFQNLYYYRDLIDIQKQVLSLFFLLGGLFCAFSAIFDRSKLSIVLFCLFLFFNLFVVQSKSSLLVLFISLGVVLCFDKEARKKTKRMLLCLAFGYLVLLLVAPSLAVPDDIRYGINRIFGTELLSSSYERSQEKLSATYDIRNDLIQNCLSLFNESPVFGIGIGNFAEVSRKSGGIFYGLDQTESEWLGIITEGGVTYLVAISGFLFCCLYKAFKLYDLNPQNKFGLAAFVFVGAYSVMFIFNDFMDSIFWIGSGILLGGCVSYHRFQIEAELNPKSEALTADYTA